MQKIDDENLSSESIETHLNKIRALLSGEKEKNADEEEQNEEVEEEKVNIVNQEPEHQSASVANVTKDDDVAEKV